ncbi:MULTISPECIES: hypothetical protein [unclassified Sphingomonas]|uniref:hypothetical protein n=1 Tax=unclassified Sphingomonas TaxID=196159 RepID=UPI001F56A676|nr:MULTISPECIES: hypothetical protein [unclassified Sphingomonas]
MSKTHKHHPKKPPHAAGKPEPKRPSRTISTATAWSIGAAAIAAGAGIAAFLTRGRIAALLSGSAAEGHVPTDLLDPKRNADDRAIADFRPDMSAPMTAAEREALRPATGPAPSMVASRGTMNAQTGASN